MIVKGSIFFIWVLVIISGCAISDQSNNKDNQLIKVHARESVALTFNTLSTELKNALSSGGISPAIEYCNLNALKLTDSLSRSMNVVIKRATDRWRNPQNKASTQELAMIKFYQTELNKGNSISDSILINENSKLYYAPIRINNLCLKCHGNENEITDYDFIKRLYPDDRAVNYKLGELRGIWSVSYLNSISENE